MKHKTGWRYLQILVILILFSLFASAFSKPAPATAQALLNGGLYPDPRDRFGITSPYAFSVDDLELFGFRAVLDWKPDNPIELPDHIEYIHVLKVSDALYDSNLASLPTIVPSNLGEVWIIGNEPDRFCFQDGISPEVYAQRYFTLATQIRSLDPSAKIGFGSIVQPTPIRIRYLQRVLDELTVQAGGNQNNARSLIDIWSIHAFILNEHPFDWGAGVPVGFYTYNPAWFGNGDEYFFPSECSDDAVYPNDILDRIPVEDFEDTYSSVVFSQRVINFRSWMKSIGEQEKPLWITEYGSLFPPIDPPPGDDFKDYVNVSDELTAEFMTGTFDFMLSARNLVTGMPADEYRLVQRWFWYSLNDFRYHYGGSLLDCENGFALTEVGEVFLTYQQELAKIKTYLPLVNR